MEYKGFLLMLQGIILFHHVLHLVFCIYFEHYLCNNNMMNIGNKQKFNT